jgi:hypothetical protein
MEAFQHGDSRLYVEAATNETFVVVQLQFDSFKIRFGRIKGGFLE